ncbi:MAG: phosphate signaling complex protein PhoU [Rhodoferax sp.]|jgi:phosphate transport system protein|uniref:phosphate signaling complex protein PhoU n=1 Tax=Rhodoferax sp. TaxID=50421 RepID=UPI003BAFA46D
MTDQHLSSQYENELHVVSAQLIELGQRVDKQIFQAIDALAHSNAEGARQVLAAEAAVNALEVEIDHEITSIIARRQPTARDLRLLMAISKASSNLERVGNEADRMAHKVLAFIGRGAPGALPLQKLSAAAKLKTDLLNRALKAFAQLDLPAAVAVIKEYELGYGVVDELVGQLVNDLIENPRKTSSCLEVISLAKSLELIVDHAKHIAELVIYVVHGADVRHTPVEQIESLVKQG